jgi:hypothetical protein
MKTELRTSNLELRTVESRAKPGKATPKPPSSQLLGRGLRPTSHPNATLKPPTCDLHATLKPPSSHPKAWGEPGEAALAGQ